MALDAGNTPLLVAELDEGLVELAKHRGSEKLAIVVADIRGVLQKIAGGLEAIAKLVGEAIPKLRTPQTVRVDLKGIAEEGRTFPGQAGFESRQQGRHGRH